MTSVVALVRVRRAATTVSAGADGCASLHPAHRCRVTSFAPTSLRSAPRRTTLIDAGFHVEATLSTGNDVEVVGRDSLETFFASAFRGLSLHLTVEQLLADSERVATQMRERIVDKEVETDEHVAAFYEVEDGLLRSVKVYREGSATR